MQQNLISLVFLLEIIDSNTAKNFSMKEKTHPELLLEFGVTSLGRTRWVLGHWLSFLSTFWNRQFLCGWRIDWLLDIYWAPMVGLVLSICEYVNSFHPQPESQHLKMLPLVYSEKILRGISPMSFQDGDKQRNYVNMILSEAPCLVDSKYLPVLNAYSV